MKRKVIVTKPLSQEEGLALVQQAFLMEPGEVEPPEDRVYRLKEVCERIGLKKSSVYELIDKGEFPKPVQLTPRAVGWLASDVRGWIRSRKRSK